MPRAEVVLRWAGDTVHRSIFHWLPGPRGWGGPGLRELWLLGAAVPRARPQDHSPPVSDAWSPSGALQGPPEQSQAQPPRPPAGLSVEAGSMAGGGQVAGQANRGCEREGWAAGSKNRPHPGLALVSVPGPMNDSPAGQDLGRAWGSWRAQGESRVLDPTPSAQPAPASKWWPV